MEEKRFGPPPLLAAGAERTKSRDAIRMNIMAARAIAEVVRTTLGPMGLDKMLVDSLGDVMVTNDGAAILREMDVHQPVARMMIEVARSQESSVGDGTTTAVVIGGELLKQAERLLEMGVHPVVITRGYHLACRECQRFLDEMAFDLADDDRTLKEIAMTTMTGKGAEQAKAHLSDIVVQAVKSIAENTPAGLAIDVDNIKIVKKGGAGVEATEFVSGLILDKEKSHAAMPGRVSQARIALVSSALEYKGKMIDAQISITAPEQLNAFIQEQKIVYQEMAARIKAVGATVIFTEKNIDQPCVNLLAKASILAVRRVRRVDLEKLARATGATIVSTIDDLEADNLGFAGLVEEKNVGGQLMIFVRECAKPRAVSILVRGGTQHIVDEVERAIEDCLGTIPAAMMDRKILAGGGASEIEAAHRLRVYSQSISGLERLAVEAFAEALEIIPKSLAENAGLNPLNILVEMRSRNEKDGCLLGLDALTGTIRNMRQEGIIEPLRVKKQAINSASEVAVMILRIDDIIAAAKLKMPTAEDMAAMAGQRNPIES